MHSSVALAQVKSYLFSEKFDPVPALPMAEHFDIQLKLIHDSCNPPKELAGWLATLNVKDIEDMAMIASSEEKLEGLFDTMKAGGVPTDDLGNRLTIKKFWNRCRSAHER